MLAGLSESDRSPEVPGDQEWFQLKVAGDQKRVQLKVACQEKWPEIKIGSSWKWSVTKVVGHKTVGVGKSGKIQSSL